MGYLSDHAANACIYATYGAVLLIGFGAVWYGRGKGQFLSGNGTRSAIPLTFNFVASGLGVGVLATYPQIGAYAGLHGLLTYSICGALPFILFGALGPVIRKELPDAFVLTEWVRHRYGVVAGLVLTACTVLTIWLFMVSELASLKACVETLTNVPGLPVLIVEAVIVSLYTSMGGFYVSFLTDNLQVFTFLTLLVVCIIATGCSVKIDPSLVGPSQLLKANKLSWKLLYILFVAIMTNDMFMSGFWLRTFAAKTNRDLYISCGLTACLLFAICAVLGVPGLLVVWAGILDPSDPSFGDDSMNSFYLLVHSLPSWLSGFVLVFCVMLSSCTFDSLQSAIVSTISNDIARNRVRIVWIRVFVMLVMVPCIVVALKAQNVLNIYLIVDVLSSAVVPVMFLGLSSYFYFLTGLEVVLSVVGGIIGVFVYGTIYYHSASEGGALLIMSQGLYLDDWGPFGAFVAAPVCSVIGAIVGIAVRCIYFGIRHGRFFAPFDKPLDGRKFHEPVDKDLFVLANPWYDYVPRSMRTLCIKIDYWLFIQGEVGEDDGLFTLPKPWYEYAPSSLQNPCRKADHYLFRVSAHEQRREAEENREAYEQVAESASVYSSNTHKDTPLTKTRHSVSGN